MWAEQDRRIDRMIERVLKRGKGHEYCAPLPKMYKERVFQESLAKRKYIYLLRRTHLWQLTLIRINIKVWWHANCLLCCSLTKALSLSRGMSRISAISSLVTTVRKRLKKSTVVASLHLVREIDDRWIDAFKLTRIDKPCTTLIYV